MRHNLGVILLAVSLLVAATTAWPAVAQTSGCQLAPVFMMLRDMLGRDQVGECTGPVIRNDVGDLSQPTTRGTLTLRIADLVTMFSDGQTTWLYGPNGLETRASTSRLPWETAGSTAAPGYAGANGYQSAPAYQGAPGSQGGPTTAGAPVGAGTGIPGSTSPVPPTVAPSPVAWTPLPIKLEGDSTTTTQPFNLAGGDYRVAWSVEIQRGNSSCYVGSRLRRFGDQNPGALLTHVTLNTSNDRTVDGETRLFSVAPGRYVLDVMTTGCSWKLAIEAPR
ncbi:MAG: hypothetical protein AB7K36_29805 [Chloroflexota bacterium]